MSKNLNYNEVKIELINILQNIGKEIDYEGYGCVNYDEYSELIKISSIM